MNQALYVGLATPAQSIFLGFRLQVLGQTGPVQRVYWLVPMGKMEICVKCCLFDALPKTHRRIASSRIEPRVSSLAIANQTLYQLSYRRRVCARNTQLLTGILIFGPLYNDD